MPVLTEKEQKEKYGELVHLCFASDGNIDESKIDELLDLGVAPYNSEWEQVKETSCIEALICSPLSEERCLGAIEKLLAKGARLDSVRTTLYQAINSDRLKVAKYLIDAGIDVNMKISDAGETILHVLAPSKRVDLVQFLLEHGANPLLDNEDDKTPLDLATDDQIKMMMRAAIRRFSHSSNNQEVLTLAQQQILSSNTLSSIEDPIESNTQSSGFGLLRYFREKITGVTNHFAPKDAATDSEKSIPSKVIPSKAKLN